MALQWGPWIFLTEAQVETLGPETAGVYEVKVNKRLVDYPHGRSAMIYYGCTREEVPTIREALRLEWMSEDKAEIRAAWSEYGELVFRFAVCEDPLGEHLRRLENFEQRFGRPPWANPEEE